MGYKKITVDPILGGRLPVAPPWIRHWDYLHAFSGADPGFSFRRAQKNISQTHITSAKSEVPFGRDPGPA